MMQEILGPISGIPNSTSNIKTVMPSASNLFDRCDGRRLQLLALFVAIALTPSMLLAEGGNHGPGKARDLVGVWMETDPSGHIGLATFHQDGTASLDIQGDVAFDPIQSHEHGLWREQGFRKFIVNFFVIEYNRDATLAGTVLVQSLYTLNSSGDRYEATLFFTETLTNGQVNTGGPEKIQGVRQILTPHLRCCQTPLSGSFARPLVLNDFAQWPGSTCSSVA
jgi:hypothetical protein